MREKKSSWDRVTWSKVVTIENNLGKFSVRKKKGSCDRVARSKVANTENKAEGPGGCLPEKPLRGC